ncbi:MAG: hypothetical protein ACTHJ4_05735, partial [Candidatus Nucleicultricaceae bacterium]
MKLSFAILLSTAALLSASLQNPVLASNTEENWDDDFDCPASEPALKMPHTAIARSSNAAAASSSVVTADLDEENWDDDFVGAAPSTATSTSAQKPTNLLAKKLKLQAHLQSLHLSAEPSRLSISSPQDPINKKASTTSRYKDDSDMQSVTAINLHAEAQSSSSNPEELDWDDLDASVSDPEPPVEVERKTPEQARREQLWSKDWYTRNSARVREAALLIKQGKIRAAKPYIDEAASAGFPHALFHQAQELLESRNNEAAQAKFEASIRA